MDKYETKSNKYQGVLLTPQISRTAASVSDPVVIHRILLILAVSLPLSSILSLTDWQLKKNYLTKNRSSWTLKWTKYSFQKSY